VAATVSAATVESTATAMEIAATTVEAASDLAMSIEAVAIMPPIVPVAIVIPVAAVPPIAIVAPVPMAPISRTSIEATMEPRASAYEDAAGEPARTVIAVGRARVRVIRVVAVGADRSWSDVAWADSHAHDNPLCTGVRYGRQANAE
jgi:hypothetical protein